jgi:hypothetical protein
MAWVEVKNKASGKISTIPQSLYDTLYVNFSSFELVEKKKATKKEKELEVKVNDNIQQYKETKRNSNSKNTEKVEG